jgi:hypothetical protein
MPTMAPLQTPFGRVGIGGAETKKDRWGGNDDNNAGRSIGRDRGGVEHHWHVRQHHHVRCIQQQPELFDRRFWSTEGRGTLALAALSRAQKECTKII